jgi:hypothetical protein
MKGVVIGSILKKVILINPINYTGASELITPPVELVDRILRTRLVVYIKRKSHVERDSRFVLRPTRGSRIL